MDRRKDVLSAFAGDKTIQLTKKEIIEKAGLYYYHNGDKHAGDVLSRMVKSGFLKRVKKGVFMLGSGKKKNDLIVNPNQVNLL